MREIKFRGISEITNKWVYGYLIKDRNENSIMVRVEKINEPLHNGRFNFNVSRELATIVKKDTIGQYTGLKDKNGIEIYEGDILTFRKNVEYSYYVAFKDAKFSLFHTKIKDFKGNCLYWGALSRAFEIIGFGFPFIIGNIHEQNDMKL